MAYRRFHVPTKYSEYADADPSRVLFELKNDIINEYRRTAKGKSTDHGSRLAAKELQDFFQELKIASKIGTTLAGSIHADLMNQIIESTIKIGDYGENKAFFQNMSGNAAERGEQFERELSNVLAAVFQLAGSSRYTGKELASRVQLGAQKVNLLGASKADLVSIVDETGRGLIQSARTQLEKNIAKSVNTKKGSQFVKTDVSGKIDVSGLMAEVVITASPTTYLYKIANLLSHASFSAKSYASKQIEYNKTLRDIFYSTSTRSYLHLGETKGSRILLDIFNTRYPYPVSISFYIVLTRSRSRDVQLSLSQLRFIYELTGYGQTYIQKTVQDILAKDGAVGANYFIYNDPASISGIYVKSTAEIIDDLIDSVNEMIIGESSVLSKYYMSSGAQSY